MVDMRVRAQDEIDRGGRNGELPRILPVASPSALEHPAVDEEPRSARLHQDAGPCDLAHSSQEFERYAHGTACVRIQEIRLISTDPATAPKKPLT
jgi:hypothetical protein